MEYFAKSKSKGLRTKEEKEKWIQCLDEIKNSLQEEWIVEEEQVIERQKQQINKKEIEVEEKQKTLKEHTDDIMECAEQFFKDYGDYFTEKEKQLIEVACQYHDYGKADLIFQSKIQPLEQKNKKIVVPHGHLSASVLNKKEIKDLVPDMTEDDFKRIATAVYHHHERGDEMEDGDFLEYINTNFRPYIEEYLGEKVKIKPSIRNHILFRNDRAKEPPSMTEENWYGYLLIKGMLNKFDWTVSAGYEQSELHTDRKEKKLIKNIGTTFQNQYREMQQYMMENTDRNLVIVSSTGSGKTEGALLWLDGEKGFYTLPLKVSSNAIYKRIKEKYEYKDVALLHSDSMNMYIKEVSDEENGIENFERAKLLSYPLTICTVDQLFSFAYKALGTEIFPATLKYSKIILDEIQSYDERVVAAIIYCLKTICDMGGKFAIITATFPPILKEMMEKVGLIEDENSIQNANKSGKNNHTYLLKDFTKEDKKIRHKIQIEDGEFDIEQIIKESEDKKVLVLCNTVKKAQNLYKELSEEIENVWVLHSNFMKKDRALLEKSILEFSSCKEAKGIWVSTQIVEASLDIDFDVLYTEMCTADSLLQRMGRCNRSGRYIPEEPNIKIYNTENGKGIIYNKTIYENSYNFLKKHEKDLIGQRKYFTEEEKTEYMNEVYCSESLKDSKYIEKIEQHIERLSKIKLLQYTKNEALKEFRNITSISVVPIRIYEEKQQLFDTGISYLKKGYIGKEVRQLIKEKLGEYTVNLTVYTNKDKKMEWITSKPIEKTDIYQWLSDYEFDVETKKGRGLIVSEQEDTCIW